MQGGAFFCNLVIIYDSYNELYGRFCMFNNFPFAVIDF